MKISIIIPASEDCKIEALESLNLQDKKPFEIIVERGNNTSENRNKGIKKAKGELIAFTNAHSILPKDWTKNIEEFFLKYSKVDIVGGPQLTPKSKSKFAKNSGIALSSIFGAANLYGRYESRKLKFNADEKDLTSANLICKKEVFKKVMFDESIYPGEDPKFISDAKKENKVIAYSPTIINYNKRRENLKGLVKQIFNYGKMRPRKESLYETIKRPIFLVPSIFVVYLIILLINSLFYFNELIFLPLIVYLLLDLIFSLKGFIKTKEVSSIAYLMLIYPSIHISYGLGLILGSIKK